MKQYLEGLHNKKKRIRISIYQKSSIVTYTISDRLKFLFSVLCSVFLLLCGAHNSSDTTARYATCYARCPISILFFLKSYIFVHMFMQLCKFVSIEIHFHELLELDEILYERNDSPTTTFRTCSASPYLAHSS